MTTATARRPKPGTRKLSEVVRVPVVKPSGIVSTGWPRIERVCRQKLGVRFDGWQDGAGRVILAERADGRLAATIGGVGMSLPRQVGKTYLLAGLIFGLCIDRPGLLVIWSAHHSRTHGETFLSMQAFARRARVSPYIEQVFKGSGDEEIRFHNGSRILFGARERGFGRGVPGVDVMVCDEAQILSDKALEDMLATMNTSRFGLALYIGTPPKPEDNSESFMRMRTEALSGESDDLVWIECGADPDDDPADPKTWAKANPSYPHRTPKESILRLKRKLKESGFRREGLGIWDGPDEQAGPIDLTDWAQRRNPKAKQPKRAVLAIAVAPDRRSSTVAAAGAGPAGRTLVMVQHSTGTSWVVREVVKLMEKHDIVEVVMNPASQAGVLVTDLIKAGVEFTPLTATERGQACGMFQEIVKDGRLVHVGQAALDAAAANGRVRKVGESQRWEPADPSIDISPLVAASEAAFAWAALEPDVTPWEAWT